VSDFAPTLARLDLANDQSVMLLAKLRKRQEDLLELEKGVRSLAAFRSVGRVVIDQAEDFRRGIRSDLPHIQDALTKAEDVLSDAGLRDGIALHLTQVTLHLVDRAASGTRRAVGDLEAVRDALTPAAQSLPSAPDLALRVQRNVDTAAGRLENARRSIFWVSEDIPAITRSMKAIAAAPLPRCGCGI
jgi:hypothetical protein